MVAVIQLVKGGFVAFDDVLHQLLIGSCVVFF